MILTPRELYEQRCYDAEAAYDRSLERRRFTEPRDLSTPETNPVQPTGTYVENMEAFFERLYAQRQEIERERYEQ